MAFHHLFPWLAGGYAGWENGAEIAFWLHADVSISICVLHLPGGEAHVRGLSYDEPRDW